jgi:hypothetical protein
MKRIKKSTKALVVLREYERGWGSKDFSAEQFTRISDAMVREKEVNDKNIAPSAPDYYIKARIIFDPRHFAEYQDLL